MAPSPKHLSLLSLLLLISSFQIQARESQFFSKSVHYNTPKEVNPVPNQALPPTQEEPSYYTQQNQNGYGLYGHGSDQVSPTTTTTTTTDNVEYNSHSVPSKLSTAEEYTNTENKKFTTTTTTSYPNNEFNNKQYGLSDTRFLEKGRYFYDVNADNRYESGEKSSKRYGSYGDMDQMNKNNYGGGYYGNNENAYEYNTSMEGYKSTQENEEDYMP